jgi:superoxide dismutase
VLIACYKTPTSALRSQARGLHRIPQLQNDAYYKANGVPEFMSPEAFDFSWTQYQTLLIDKLNLLTQGKSDLPYGILAATTSWRLSQSIRRWTDTYVGSL